MASTSLLNHAGSRRAAQSGAGLSQRAIGPIAPTAFAEQFFATFGGLDPETHAHAWRVHGYSVTLGRRLGIGAEALDALANASLLHDIGKLAVPSHILNKPGPLTPEEFSEVKRHSAAGARLVARARFSGAVTAIVRHHHENWDGTGYPDRVAGRDIPIGARVLMVVDCFDALTSDRPYRSRLSIDVAVQIIEERRGTMYDPRVVDAFIRTLPTHLAPQTFQ